LIEPIAHWDVKVRDLAVVECVTSQGLVEGILVVEDMLLKAMESVFVSFV
jgi:hypothetical protein